MILCFLTPVKTVAPCNPSVICPLRVVLIQITSYNDSMLLTPVKTVASKGVLSGVDNYRTPFSD